MDKDFMQYVYARCEKALSENDEYMELQSKCVEAMKNHEDELANDISDQMESMAEKLCYLQGCNDAIKMIINLK